MSLTDNGNGVSVSMTVAPIGYGNGYGGGYPVASYPIAYPVAYGNGGGFGAFNLSILECKSVWNNNPQQPNNLF